MTRYLGGLITKDESLVIPADNYENTSAPGVWTLEEAQMLAKQGLWPTVGNSQRGIFGGGYTTGFGTNTMSYITITSTGNTTDFGDLTASTYGPAAFSSSTRGIFGAGANSDLDALNIIEFVTIANTGNGTDFGDLSVSRWQTTGTSNSTRGLFAGSQARANTIDYVTIASAGNATDFGDLDQVRSSTAGCSNTSRGIIAGGYSDSGVSLTNGIQYITIASAGNSTNFGDLPSEGGSSQFRNMAGCSNAHGGLS